MYPRKPQIIRSTSTIFMMNERFPGYLCFTSYSYRSCIMASANHGIDVRCCQYTRNRLMSVGGEKVLTDIWVTPFAHTEDVLSSSIGLRRYHQTHISPVDRNGEGRVAYFWVSLFPHIVIAKVFVSHINFTRNVLALWHLWNINQPIKLQNTHINPLDERGEQGVAGYSASAIFSCSTIRIQNTHINPLDKRGEEWVADDGDDGHFRVRIWHRHRWERTDLRKYN